jgi:hypothetical protein
MVGIPHPLHRLLLGVIGFPRLCENIQINIEVGYSLRCVPLQFQKARMTMLGIYQLFNSVTMYGLKNKRNIIRLGMIDKSRHCHASLLEF